MNHHEVPRDENVTGIPSNESSNSESKFLDFLGNSYRTRTQILSSSNIFHQLNQTNYSYPRNIDQSFAENTCQSEESFIPFPTRFFPLSETFYADVRLADEAFCSTYSNEGRIPIHPPPLKLLQYLQYQQALRNYSTLINQFSYDNRSCMKKDYSVRNKKECEVDKKHGSSFSSNSRLVLPMIIEGSLSEKILSVEVELAKYLTNLNYARSPVRYISNPIDHAHLPHKMFLEKYLDGEKSVLFLGMNPGPWGMCQTGVPFGDIMSCESFLGIVAEVNKCVPGQHPKRPILGFSCKRKEVSGSRFWTFFKSICGRPDNFFKSCFVLNYCPLAFMKDSGKNIGAAELSRELRDQVNQACDVALHRILGLLNVKLVVGVGKFAEGRAKSVIKEYDLDISVGSLMHPSPINPAANKGWDKIAYTTLQDLRLLPLLHHN